MAEISIPGYASIPNPGPITLAYATGHPRVLATSADLTTGGRIYDRCILGGTHRTEYSRLKTWVDAHISDTISGISQDSDWRGWGGINNMSLHLIGNALCHKIDGGTQYGNRVRALLDYIGTSGTGAFNNYVANGNDSDSEVMAKLSFAIAYDWCYDRITGQAEKTNIDGWLSAVVTSSLAYHGTSPVTYKTEEPVFAGHIAAMALATEGVADTNCNTNLTYTTAWLKGGTGCLGQYEDAGPDGGASFLGSYMGDQVQAYLTWFAESYEHGTTQSIYTGWTDITSYTPGLTWNTPGSKFLRQHAKWLMHTMSPYGKVNAIGDAIKPGGVGGSQYLHLAATAQHHQDSTAKAFFDAVEDINGTTFYDNNNSPGLIYSSTSPRNLFEFWQVLFFDRDLTGSLVGVDKGQYFSESGYASFRSGMTYGSGTDISGFIGASRKATYVHWHGDQGHIKLSRGNDEVLNNSGYYNYWDLEHYDNYFVRAESHNTVIVNDESHNIYGGRNWSDSGYSQSLSPADTANIFGSITKFQHADDKYTYAQADIAEAFKALRVDALTRNVCFLDNKYLVVFDRVDKQSSAYNSRVLWHCMTEPSCDGTGWSSTPGYTDLTTNSSVIDWTVGSAKTYLRCLSPTANLQFRKIGGNGYEYCDVSFVNQPCDHVSCGAVSDVYGQWRFEVENTGTQTQDNYLQVIQPVAAAASEVASTLYTSTGNIGCVISAGSSPHGVFYADTETTRASMSVTLPALTAATIVVCDLTAGTYTVTSDGTPVATGVVVDGNGVLVYEGNVSAGTFSVN